MASPEQILAHVSPVTKTEELWMNEKADKVLALFQSELDAIGPTTTELPEVYRSKDEEGCISFEWMLPNKRLGIVFDRNEQGSGWYYVAKVGSEIEVQNGTLVNIPIPELLQKMLTESV